MIVFKIEPIEFNTVSGLPAAITGLAPQKNECILVGTVEAHGGKLDMTWFVSGETLDGESKAFNLTDDAEVDLREIASLSRQICPG